VTPDGRFAYVTNVLPSTLTIIDLASAAIVKTIPVGTTPTSIVMRTDGRYAYVSCQGNASVFVIDTKTQEITQSIVVDSNPITLQVR
jgi:YVTN family beta-propeller protein